VTGLTGSPHLLAGGREEAGGGTGPRRPKGGTGRAGRRKKGREESGPWAEWGRERGLGFVFFFFKSFLNNFSNPFLNQTC
jgi:hypothetical protein